MTAWAYLGLTLLAMLSVLTAYQLPIFNTTNLGTGWIGFLLPVVLVGAGVGFWRIKGAGCNPILKAFVVMALLVVSVLGFGYRSFLVYADFEHTRPKQSLQVSATAKIYEISDSVYNPAMGLGFRQKAVLSDVKLSNGNPANLPENLTVLLTASPHKPSKSRPTDPLSALSELKVGDEVAITVKLMPLSKTQTGDFDSYKWLATRHIQATAQVISLDKTSIRPVLVRGLDNISLTLEKWREHYRQVFFGKNTTTIAQDKAVTLSLLTGDRAYISKQIKDLYQYGGVSHLLAISGTHILFLAVVLANLTIGFINRYAVFIYQKLARWQIRFVLMVAVSLLYAIFTGFEVPAVRTVLMLVAFGLGRYLLLGVSSLKLVAMTALVMAYLDPLVLWQAGFWLSFVAVAILVLYETSEQGENFRQKCLQFAKLQLIIFVAMLPVSLLIFDKVSLFGLFVNLFAVSLFGLVVVPINLLAGVVHWLLPALAEMLWSVSASILGGFEKFLAICQLTLGERWLNVPMTVAVVVLCFMAFLVFVGKILPKRFGILPMLVAIFGLMGQTAGQTAGDEVLIENLAEANLSATLVRHNETAWLILSGAGKSLSDEKLSQTLLTKLQKRTDNLSGIIVQDDSELLLKTAGRLSLAMPVYELWWAGDERKIGNLTVQHCGADKADKFADGSIRILTGWQFGTKMNSCAVLIEHELPSRYDGQVFTNTAVLIDNSQNNKLWGVYRLLCQSVPSVNLFLTNSQSATEKIDVAMFGKPVVAFSDTASNAIRLNELNSP